MDKKNIPFEFVFDHLFPLEARAKKMFGLFAIYIGEKIVLILRQRNDHPGTNGVWVATNQAHHKSFKNDIPSLRSISDLSNGLKETEWQLIPVDAEGFEYSVIKVCELIKQGDLRVGRIPIPGKSKKKISGHSQCKKTSTLIYRSGV
jgi:hypothetical protein